LSAGCGPASYGARLAKLKKSAIIIMATSLLHYRGWNGQFRSSWFCVWPIARVALATLLRRRMFWVLYSAGLLLFLLFFMGAYLIDFIEAQIPDNPVQIGNFKSHDLVDLIRKISPFLSGSRATFSEFFARQAAIVIVVLSLAGSIIVGNDYVHRSVPFYLSKPIGRWQYLLGKGLAIGVVVNMLTTLPALLLYLQHGFDDYHYFMDADYFETSGGGPSGWLLLLGLLGYGAVLTVFLSITLVALATAVRRTVPLVMAWTSMFLFLRILGGLLAGVLGWDHHWRLLDLWNDMSLLGRACLGYDNELITPGPQPSFLAAGLTLAGVSAVCLIYLNLRTRAVDIIR
jgi:ABC-type transport system involved in multi-copper enzyme maturation permease subunit